MSCNNHNQSINRRFDLHVTSALYFGCKMAEHQLATASEALRIATEFQPEREVTDILHLQQDDGKPKPSKYKRWSPTMDLVLVSLLSDVVHSFPEDGQPVLDRRSWAYVCGRLRSINPQTVYSTYTKYSCQQHLLNVIHHRYKVWYALLMHQKREQTSHYSYRWNPDLGRFQLYDVRSSILVQDEIQIKSILYSDALSLPPLAGINRGPLILSDFFFTDSLKYISVYHNEVLSLLLRLDPAFGTGLEHVYEEVPRFEHDEGQNGYNKPLIKQSKDIPSAIHPPKKRQLELDSESLQLGDILRSSLDEEPQLKRPRPYEFDSNAVLESASIAAIQSPPVGSKPIYLKDRIWFNKLIALQRSSLLTADEVLVICEGVRDGKIPLFMLNILDTTYSSEGSQSPEFFDDVEISKRVRQFMLPMT